MTDDIKPQEGQQTAFLAADEDFVIYGGAAGGGKTWSLLLDPLHYIHVPGFRAVLLRRENAQITQAGGLIDQSRKIYPMADGESRANPHKWLFPGGAEIAFSGIQYENDVYKFQGAELAWIGFDELTHFSFDQFLYLLSRNRSVSGVRPVVRATCNPDPSSWVLQFVAPFLDKDGYARKEMSGMRHWFVVIDGKVYIEKDKAKLIENFGKDVMPKSYTFIPSTLSDNRILQDKDPGYLANLKAQSNVNQMRLLYGNWYYKEGGGEFKHEFMRFYDNYAKDFTARGMNVYIMYDPANSKKSLRNSDPDYTAMMVVGCAPDNNYYILDMIRDRLNPTERVHKLIQLHMKWNDKAGQPPKVVVEQYGMMTDSFYIERAQKTMNYRFPLVQVGGRTKKEDRIRRLIPIHEAERLYLPKKILYTNVNGEERELVKEFIDHELTTFPVGAHDDMLDALARILDEEVYHRFPKIEVRHISLRDGKSDYETSGPEFNDFMNW